MLGVSHASCIYIYIHLIPVQLILIMNDSMIHIFIWKESMYVGILVPHPPHQPFSRKKFNKSYAEVLSNSSSRLSLPILKGSSQDCSVWFGWGSWNSDSCGHPVECLHHWLGFDEFGGGNSLQHSFHVGSAAKSNSGSGAAGLTTGGLGIVSAAASEAWHLSAEEQPADFKGGVHSSLGGLGGVQILKALACWFSILFQSFCHVDPPEIVQIEWGNSLQKSSKYAWLYLKIGYASMPAKVATMIPRKTYINHNYTVHPKNIQKHPKSNHMKWWDSPTMSNLSYDSFLMFHPG